MDNVKKFSVSKIVSILALSLVSLGLTSCLDDDSSSGSKVPVAYVSLYNASPDAPSLDIELDDQQINMDPFQYAEYIGYLRFRTGERNLAFGPYASSSIKVDRTFNFEANKAYSVFVVDEYDDARIVILNDNPEPPASGKAKVRIINLSPDAGPVNFMIEDDTDNWATELDFEDATDFTDVDAGEYDFQVRSASNDEFLLSLPNIELQARFYYTIIIRGYETPPGGSTSVLAGQVIVN